MMESEAVPEIQRTNLEDVVLYLKELDINDVLAVDFLDPPDKYHLRELILPTVHGSGTS